MNLFKKLSFVSIVILLLSVCQSKVAQQEVVQPIQDDVENSEEVDKQIVSQKAIESKVLSTDTASDNWEGTNKSDEEIALLIPKGWHVISSVEGDLNKDFITDKAFVIEELIETEYDLPRKLLIAFGNQDGGYTLSIEAENAILSKSEGGPFGDPFQEMIIDRGSLVLKYFGGSSERWYKNYRFRYQDGGWYLIGATEGGLVFAEKYNSMDSEEEDYNLLTGDYIFRKLVNGEIVISSGNRGVKELVSLQEFNVRAANTQF